MSDRQADVLVVGAGPAGSASAAFLAQGGARVIVVDRGAFPRDKACSEYMSPEAVRVLDRLGLVADLERAGAAPLAGTIVYAPRGSRLEGVFALASHRPYRATGLSVARRVLDAHLVRAARDAGAEVIERTTVEELLYERGAVAGALVRSADGGRQAIRARLTVGADGLRSVVARRIGRRSYGVPRRIGLVAHVAGVPGLVQSAEMHVGPAGYVGLNPLGQDVANVALVVPAERMGAARGRRAGFFYETLNEFAGVRGRVDPRRQIRPVLVTGPFAARSTRIAASGALLVGDAADFFDPFTGEGICSALRGAELVAEHALPALAAGTTAELTSYLAARRRAFAGKWAVERLIGYGMWFPALFDRAVARLGCRPGMAHTLIGVTGDFVPAREVLNPRFLARMVW